MLRNRWSAKEVLTLAVGVTLAVTFCIIVAGVMYSLIFVTQPLGPENKTGQALTDKMLIESILVPIVLFLSGALSGVLAANGLSNRKPAEDGTSSPAETTYSSTTSIDPLIK